MNGGSHSGDALEIAPGLVRWTAPHPDWDPDAAAGHVVQRYNMEFSARSPLFMIALIGFVLSSGVAQGASVFLTTGARMERSR